MIIGKNITLVFGERKLFDAIDFTFEQSAKIGCVGRNGAGKSTMLKVIAGIIKPDEGEVCIERGRKIAYLPQEVVLQSTKNVLDEAYTAFSDMVMLQNELDDVEQKLEHEEFQTNIEILERYAYLQEKLSLYNPSEALINTRKMLAGLGFSESQLTQEVNALSVGWKMRLVLAKLLLQNADFYLFDEPTNHLDIVTKEWFVDFLKNAPCGYLLVSHDRYFLDHACEDVFELERGYGTLYKGNYTHYLEQKKHNELLLKREFDQQERDIQKKLEWAERFKAKISTAKRAQSVLRSLEKVERIELPPTPPSIHLNFGHIQQAGKIVLTVKDLSYGYGARTLFKDVSFEIPRGEKVALVAANGVGKTTLFSLIAQKMVPHTGSIEMGHNVQWTLFEQDQDKVLHHQKTVLDEAESVCTTSEARQKVRSFLAAFLFMKDDVHKKIGVLSGGEKNRVAMVKTLLTKSNFLLLDEPTNHLDLDAKDILLKALKQFSGTLLFVSHDRVFLDDLATMVIELTPHGVHTYAGNFSSYLYHKSCMGLGSEGVQEQHGPTKLSLAAQTSSSGAQKKQDPQAASDKKNIAPGLSGKEAYELRKKVTSIERKIEKTEARLQELALEPFSDETKNETKRLKELSAELTQEWELLQKKLYC